MVHNDKISGYLIQTELPFEEIDEGMWIVQDSDDDVSQQIVVSHNDVIVHFRLKVMNLPEDKCIHKDLFYDLLKLNSTGLTHGAFAIEEDAIVLIDTLQIENLDFNEFQASIESLFLGIIDSYDQLLPYFERQKIVK